MAVKAVIDTNIWVSAIINPFGYPAALRKNFENGGLIAVVSEPILNEISDVLSRPRIKNKYNIELEDIEELLLIEEKAEHFFKNLFIMLYFPPYSFAPAALSRLTVSL